MIPNYFFDDFHATFKPTDILLIDRNNNVVIRAPHIINAETSVTQNLNSEIEWDINLHGYGSMEVCQYGPAICITDKDIVQIIEDDIFNIRE